MFFSPSHWSFYPLESSVYSKSFGFEETPLKRSFLLGRKTETTWGLGLGDWRQFEYRLVWELMVVGIEYAGQTPYIWVILMH
jgi:hypothetical protein